MAEYHEPVEEISAKDRDFHRALASLKEEVEAVMWYNDRAATTQDPTIKAVIEHNRNEEMEHAAMLLEWLRRNMPGWDEALRTYLFTEAPITEIEALAASGEGSSKGEGSDLDLNIGSLKE
ncbi:MAG: ferritin [Acetomicrobium flavidum]|uniref:ferritin-like domain-containing protein n=1 Tax=Acetomicrobium flavidum TaxID=49896 RepID=UPI0016A6F614|nr:ferritin [Acetomicrobium flavidum]